MGARTAPLLTTLDEKIAPGNAAVVVVDVQNDFIAPDGWAGRVGWETARNAAAAERLVPFLDAARSAGVPIVFIQATYDARYQSGPQIERNRRRGIDSPRCLEGTWGAEFYLVRPEPGEPIVNKHRLSAFVHTELETVLRHLDVQSLLMTGVYTEGCVESTLRDGYFLDYYIVLVEDCCGTTTAERHQGVIDRVAWDYGIVATSHEVMAAWRPTAREASGEARTASGVRA